MENYLDSFSPFLTIQTLQIRAVLGMMAAFFLSIAHPLKAQQWTTEISQLNTIQMFDEQKGYVCGTEGLLLKTMDGGQSWQPVYTGFFVDFRNIWGSDTTNIWLSSNTSIFHFNGKKAVRQVQTGALINEIKGFDNNNVWAAGYGPSLFHFDGYKWQTVISNTADTMFKVERFNCLWIPSPNDVWLAGQTSGIFRFDGLKYRKYPVSKAIEFKDIWGIDTSNVWAVGVGGVVYRFDGITWTAQDRPTHVDLVKIWGNDAQQIWVLDAQGNIYFFDGQAWRLHFKSPQPLYVYNVSVLKNNSLWMAGLSTVQHFNGKGWRLLNVWSPYIYHLSCTSDQQLISVSSLGKINVFDGKKWWQQYHNPSSSQFFPNTAWGLDTHNIWVNHINGFGLLRDGKFTPVVEDTALRYRLINFWGVDNQNIWAAGAKGFVWKFDGSQWHRQNISTDQYLLGIYGSDTSNIWLVGTGATVFQKTADGWHQHTLPISNTENLMGVWSYDATHTWVGGQRGKIYFFDGKQWHLQKTNAVGHGVFSFIAGIDTLNIWAININSEMYRFDGKSWQKVNTPYVGYPSLAICGGKVWITEDDRSPIYSHVPTLRLPDPPEPIYHELHIFPNPTSGVLHLRGVKKTTSWYQIFDALGQLVMEGNYQNRQLDLSNLPAGCYFLKLEEGLERVIKS